MAEIINLRRTRKTREREAAKAQADANRLQHGRTKVEREGSAREAERVTRLLDSARRESDD